MSGSKYISPDSWTIERNCQGMQTENFQWSGCRKTYSVAYFDLYRNVSLMSVFNLFGGTNHLTSNCPHCSEPNYLADSVLNNLDPRFVSQIPNKFNRFLKRY